MTSDDAPSRQPSSGRRGPPVALTIAGSDSGGGAGIQADLKSFAANGAFGTTAVTALTAQNSVGVTGVAVTAPAFVDAQIAAVLDDLPVAAVKTGMLATRAIIGVVAARAAAGDLPNLVVDPVMVASSGGRLLDEDAETAYLEELFPHAVVITPNMSEAGLLVGRRLTTVDDMRAAARTLHGTGARYVLVKGGHLTGDAVDVLDDGSTAIELRGPRVTSANVHGTGCSLSAAIAARLAGGATVVDAVRGAKDYVATAIAGAAGWRLGAGHGPIDHFGWGSR
jgi:hydroxymethylpyrimidine/phosphomethylpyrimidine kinase